MAATGTKAPAVGSSQWIQNEREQAGDFARQEVEEFSFSVRNEMEWLNEHMSDIFSTTQINFADVFKTPGKLRGKTPRTARKRDPLAPRQPLQDIFAPNPHNIPPPLQKTAFYDKIAQFDIAEDAENQAPLSRPFSRARSPLHLGKPYTDSGYHGTTDDEVEVAAPRVSIDASSQETEQQQVTITESQQAPQRVLEGKGEEAGVSDDSFVSAKEQKSDGATVADVDERMPDAPEPLADEEAMIQADENAVVVSAPSLEQAAQYSQEQQDQDVNVDMVVEAEVDVHAETASQSDVSSPEKPLQRKSSTFSALPPREPLGSKRSMSQIDAQRNSLVGRSTGGRPMDRDLGEDDAGLPERSAETMLHNKTSAQLLHERIAMLGKTKEPRSSKSIPQNVLSAQPGYPQLPTGDPSTEDTNSPPSAMATYPADDEDDDWIATTKPAQAALQQPQVAAAQVTTEREAVPVRPVLHQKSMSTTQISSPRPGMGAESRHIKAMSVSHPNFIEALKSTTPAGSPMGKGKEGPLSASKSRLWSILKSAKDVFASSASASAAAKLEAHSNAPSAHNSPKRDISGESHAAAVYNMPGALYNSTHLQQQSPSRPISVISWSPSRKTRSSSESDKKREKELKAQQKHDDQLEKAREKEKQVAAKQQEQRVKADRDEAERLEKENQKAAAAQVLRPMSSDSDQPREMPPPPPPKNGSSANGNLRAPGRPVRPVKEPAASKPASVPIRVASQRSAVQSALSRSQHETLAPAPPAKDPIVRTASSQSTSSAAPANARGLKALEAAARKKEADEKAAQKKAEQKKKIEQKRAAKAEEEKRAEEERKAEEQRRVQELKAAAQRKAERQAAEAKRREQERLEQQRREQVRIEQQRREAEQQRREAEQQRQQDEARKAREAHDLAESIRRERAQQTAAHPRSDVAGTLRQLAKSVTQIHVNPAKPPKRQLPDENDGPSNPQRPGMPRGPPSYQQTDAKRRRTNEESEEPIQRVSVMAPPKRPSTMRKETLSKYPHGYTSAPPPVAPHSSIYKTTVSNQHQLQHKVGHPSQMVQISNARIPFAENANPPAPAAMTTSYQALASSLHSYETTHAPNTASKYKTPARPAHPPMKSGKSTPSYKNGDNIELPEIATDSEDEEDSEDENGTAGFRAPSWVDSPALRDLLTQQQLVDPETVFGPIGELKMDEVFKNSKNQERLKRFRDRGSSALWVESGDAVTSAEKRRDREGRERVVREGGWRYDLPGGGSSAA